MSRCKTPVELRFYGFLCCVKIQKEWKRIMNSIQKNGCQESTLTTACDNRMITKYEN